jgi:hypothetical protein
MALEEMIQNGVNVLMSEDTDDIDNTLPGETTVEEEEPQKSWAELYAEASDEPAPLPEPPKKRGLLEDIVPSITHGLMKGMDELHNTVASVGNAMYSASRPLPADKLRKFADELGIDGAVVSGPYDDNFSYYSKEQYENTTPQTKTGRIFSALANFVPMYALTAPIGGAVGATTKVGKFAAMTGRSALTTALVVDPYEERLSTLLSELPIPVAQQFNELLKADPNDSRAVAKLKAVVEDVGLGVVTEGLIKVAGSAVKYFRGIKAGQSVEEASKAFESVAEEVTESASRVAGVAEAPTPLNVTFPPGTRDKLTDTVNSLNRLINRGTIPKSAEFDKLQRATRKRVGSLPKEQRELLAERVTDIFGNIQSGNFTQARKGMRGLFTTSPQDIGDYVNPGRAAREAGINTEETTQRFAEEVGRRVVNDIPDQPFRGIADVINATHLKPEAKKIASALTSTLDDLDLRGDFRSLSLPVPEMQRQATDVVTKLLGSEEATALDAFFKTGGDIGDAVAVYTLGMKAHIKQRSEQLGAFVTSLGDGLTEEDLAQAFLKRGDGLLNDYMLKASQFEGLTTGLGRALRNLRWDVTLDIDTIAKAAKQSTGVLKEAVKKLSAADKLQLMRRMAVGEDVIKMSVLAKISPDVNKWLALSNEIWFNAVLSGPQTHFVNILGNLGKQGILEPIENMLAGLVGRAVKGKWTPEYRQMWIEGSRAWANMYSVMGDSWAMAKKSLSLGDSVISPRSTAPYVPEKMGTVLSGQVWGVDASSSLGKAVNALGMVVNAPTRFLMASDELFKQAAYRAHVKSTLYTKGEEIAKGMGLTGANLKDFIAKYIDDNTLTHFKDIILPDGTYLKNAAGIEGSEALNFAQKMTYTQPLTGGLTKGLESIAAKHPLFRRFALPFLKTPANIGADTIDHLPLISLIWERNRAILSEGGPEAAKLLARWSVGSAVMVSVAMLAQNNRITGAGPTNRAHRDLLYATGWRPHSIVVGNTYYDYSRLEPIGGLLAIGANFADIASAYEESGEDDQTLSSLGSAILYAIAKPLTSKTYFRGLSEALNVLYNGDEATLKSWVESQFVSYFPPNVLRHVNRAIDPEMKEIGGYLDRVRAGIPGLSDELPARYSWLTGKPMMIHGGRLASFMPITWDTADEENPVFKELLKYPDAITGPRAELGGTALNAERKSDYHRLHGSVKIAGMTMLQALEKAINSPKYKAAEDEEDVRYSMLRKVVTQYRNAARRELLILHPNLRETLQEGGKRGSLRRLLGQAQMEANRRDRALESVSAPRGKIRRFVDELKRF